MFDIPPTIQEPGPDEIREKGAKHHLNLTDEEVEVISEIISERVALYEHLDSLEVPEPDVKYTTRESLGKPDDDEDPHNAFVTRCYVQGAKDGLLSGYEIGLKDNIAVAGIQMTCGSRVLEGFIPSIDATLVTRLLDAGADITGKLNMGDMALYGSFSATGPMLNPQDERRLSGGSSGGSAIAVVNEDVDIAIGTDQAGSVRIPAAWSGCVGMKPTYGRVPYTGIASHSRTYDHAGPMARTVEDCARALDAIAGTDPLDPRQPRRSETNCVESLDSSLDTVDIGVISEGIEAEYVTEPVKATVYDAIESLEVAGASINSVSVPDHRDGLAIFHAMNVEDVTMAYNRNGLTTPGKGFYDTDFAMALGRGRKAQARDLPPSVKLMLVLGQYLSDEYFGQYYAKAQNLTRRLTAAYDRALEDYKVLALPTMPLLPTKLEEAGEMDNFLQRLANTCPFNATGHPAISVPCGDHEGAPVGMMFVGEHGRDETVLRVAHAVERSLE